MQIDRKIKYVDLFSGIGGFNLAAQTSRYSQRLQHIAFCEIDKQARELYKAFYNVHMVQEFNDVNTIYTNSSPIGFDLEQFDLLFAGFPCQSFSNVGTRGGLNDDRGKLFFKILDILNTYKPKYFILENVQKISTFSKGELLLKMTKLLEECGYHLHVWDLLASDYGLPQKRRRIFFCGARKDSFDFQDLSPPNKLNLEESIYPTVWHLLEKGFVDEKHYIPLKTRKTVLYKNPKWQGDVFIDNPIARPLTASMSKWHRANQDNYYSDSYINSINPMLRPNIDLDKERIRRITPLEGFRLQGFPDRFFDAANEAGLSYSTLYRLIGNAVPVPLAEAVISHFLSAYKDY